MLGFTHWSIQKCWECNFSSCGLKQLVGWGRGSSGASAGQRGGSGCRGLPGELQQPRWSQAITSWGEKATAQVCGRDIVGYQSVACFHTGTMVAAFQCFFLESWQGKEPWDLQRGPHFCKKIRLRKEWQHCGQTKDMLEGWDQSWRVFTEYFRFSTCYILHSCVWAIYCLAMVPAVHLTRNQSFPS